MFLMRQTIIVMSRHIEYDQKNQVYNHYQALDTEFYKTATALPTFTGNWVKQVCKITKDYPNNVYTRVCGTTTKRIQELDALDNLRHEDLDVFLNRINNTKDF